jgi:phosphoenolpyruvate synthase/pyruvate phosphate dikinase
MPDKKFRFQSKSQTLQILSKQVKSALILDQISFTAANWQKNSAAILTEIKSKKWFAKKLIVRSSAVAEDSLNNSCAGYFDSVLNVYGEKEIAAAVQKVIKSFSDNNPQNQVFIQPMLCDIKLSGVAFTRDPNNNSPYIVINFDDKTGRSDSVTAGDSNAVKTFYFHKLHKKKFGDFRDKILTLCFELEKITGCAALDIEFAIDAKDKIYLFQVRPLVIRSDNCVDEKEHYKVLTSINSRLKSWMKKHPYLGGDTAIYGVMPDWNPAEIIGARPKPLAVSLYREVITNSIWAYQRDNYGYRNLRSFPLLVELDGMPYIDIRVSFNSFIPASLDEKIAHKLANFYLKKLIRNPHLHDKVEFEIVFSCFTLNTTERLAELKDAGFASDEISQIKSSLLNLTNKIISPKFGLWKEDLQRIEILKTHHQKIFQSDLDDYAKMYWLIEDCKRYGTLPFAGLARAAFIAVEILKSMVTKNLLSKEEYHLFLSSLNTVSSSIGEDFSQLSKKEFLQKYGHLRPGTYDISSKRYDEDCDGYFNFSQKKQNKENIKSFKLSKPAQKKIQKSLDENGFEISVVELFDFCKNAIEAREYSKFIFTRSISDFLKIYQEIALRDLKISIEDAAYTHASSIFSLASSSSNPKRIITASIARRKQRFEITKSINLPALITAPEDVFAFYEMESHPNYITQKKVSGEVQIVKNGDKNIRGKIVLIESADPGYDWIFSHKIKGLITKYGGVNSHMAIRAAELEIPAIIGAGKYYDEWKVSKIMTIDCLSKVVTTNHS